MTTPRAARCTFIPPWLVERVDGPERAARDDELRRERALRGRAPRPAPPSAEGVVVAPAWTVHDAESRTTLPGTPARSAGEPETGDVAVDEAATGIEATLQMFLDDLGRDSHDGEGAPISLTVHYGSRYNNAFWDGTQLVFGDGDGRVFERFTKPVDVLGHELTHAVTEHTAGLRYQDQPGALNESISDVFGSCLKQWLLGQDVDQADWLIGAGLFLPGVQARGLRDMANPGTAYDDPKLGKDPQGASMDQYVDTRDDNGGVHLNSGIPNRAFHLAATAIGGHAWEGAGPIWYAALTGSDVSADTDFAGFAAATFAAAGEHADAVQQAWETVGVIPKVGSTSAGSRTGEGTGEQTLVSVRRTGGFAGRVAEGAVDLASEDSRVPEVRSLVDRIDLTRVPGGNPHPDMYVYAFDLCGRRAQVPEHHLTPELSRLAVIVLERGDPAF
jgi:hypothetical protein